MLVPARPATIRRATVVQAGRDSANRIRTRWLRAASSRGSAHRPRLGRLASCSSKEAATYSPFCSFRTLIRSTSFDQPLPHIVDEKRFGVSNRLDDCSSLNFLLIGGRHSRSWVNSPSAGGDKRIAARSLKPPQRLVLLPVLRLACSSRHSIDSARAEAINREAATGHEPMWR